MTLPVGREKIESSRRVVSPGAGVGSSRASAARRSHGLAPKVLAALFALVLPGVIQACAAPASGTTSSAFVRVDAQDWAALVGPPPAADSQTAKDDLAVLLWVQRTRSSSDVERAWGAASPGIGAFQRAIGDPLMPQDFPALHAVMEEIFAACIPIIAPLKNQFARTRPGKLDPRIKPALPTPQSGSYPSGTAVLGIVAGELLADLLPSRRRALEARAIEIGDLRVVAGAHFPSDVEAGQKLGRALAGVILESPDWQERRKALAPEVEKIRAGWN